jgi:hypothetical protein
VLGAGLVGSGAAGGIESNINLAGDLFGSATGQMPSPSIPARDLRSEDNSHGAARLQLASAADELEDCPTVEDSLAQIAVITEGAEIADIVAALAQVQGSPASAAEDESPLAQRLRDALNLAVSPPCASAGQAVSEALRLAQLAQESVETAALSPEDTQSRFSDERSGIATGASVSGYN